MSREQQPQQPQYGTGGWQPMPQAGEVDPEATAFVQLPPDAFGPPDGEPDPAAPLAAPGGHGYVPPPIAMPATDPAQTGQFQIPPDLAGAQPAGPGGAHPDAGPDQDRPPARPEAWYQAHPQAHPQARPQTQGPAPAAYQGRGPEQGPYPGRPGHDSPQGSAPHPADREGPPVEGQISAWRPVRPDEQTAPPWAIPSAGEDVPEDSGEYALHDRTGAGEPGDAGAREHTRSQDAAPEAAPPEDEAGAGAGAEDGAGEPTEPVGEAAPDEHPLASYVLRVNGGDRPVTGAWIGESLLYVLRERLGLAGAKDGCSQGECGACSVKVDGRLVAACLVPAATAAGTEIRTVEGLADQGVHSDVQRALAASGAVQCGFCVPGLAMTVHDLLEGNHTPSELEARQALSGNLCRCTGYRGVLDAVREVITDRRAVAQEAEAARDEPSAHIPQQARSGEQGGAHPGHGHRRMPPPRHPGAPEGGRQ